MRHQFVVTLRLQLHDGKLTVVKVPQFVKLLHLQESTRHWV